MNCFGRVGTKHRILSQYFCAFFTISVYHQYEPIKRKRDEFPSFSRLSIVASCEENSLSTIASMNHDQYSYDADDQIVTNWSSTHSCNPDHIYYPKNPIEVQAILRNHHVTNTKIRPIGNALSPNGIGMCDNRDKTDNNSKSQIQSMNSKARNLINVSLIDHVHVNKNSMTVTVGAGATVDNVLKELKKHGLTLANFSSIKEQQIAGWTQIAAHGTGCQFSTVDEMITEIQLVSPVQGILRILPSAAAAVNTGAVDIATTPSNVTIATGSNDNVQQQNESISTIESLLEEQPKDSHFIETQGRVIASDEMLNMVKVGLGSLGVITELTLQCIPEIQLKEKISHINREEMFSSQREADNHINRLLDCRHLRYMWLPYTKSVISVASKVYDDTDADAVTSTGEVETIAMKAMTTTAGSATSPQQQTKQKLESEDVKPTKALCDLVKHLYFSPDNGYSNAPHPSMSTVDRLSFTQLRDLLLDYDPLNVQIIKKVNQAEESYWQSVASSSTLNTRIDYSNNILGFDCGGEQWVYEVCIPIGTAQELKSSKIPKDMEFMKKLITLIESADIPAPCPIEQRWTCGSTAYMSPAYSPHQSIISSTSTQFSSQQSGVDNSHDHISNNDKKSTTNSHQKKMEEKGTAELFTWVGIIMYLPLSQTTEQRLLITKQFRDYCTLVEPLIKEYNGYPHWAKLELPPLNGRENNNNNSGNDHHNYHNNRDSSDNYEVHLQELMTYLRLKYPIDRFNLYRKLLDPKEILSNSLIDHVFDSKEI